MMKKSRAWAGLLAMLAAFVAWHVPLMLRVAAGQDEDFYAIPGIAVLSTGLPAIPTIPSRDPNTVYYHADEVLYTLPPLQFYIQAGFHALIGPGLFAARMASLAAGLATIVLVFDLARIWLNSARAGLFAAGLFLFSRAFAFPATMARPDMTAIAFGVLGVWFTARWWDDRANWPILAAGAAVGASMLSHPLGMVPSLQLGVWMLARSGGMKRRFVRATLLTAAALAVLALWLPLIALHPEWLEVQFVRNILMRRAGPNAGMALRTPWGFITYQATCLRESFGPIQCGLYAIALAWAVRSAVRRRPRSAELLYHALAALVILVVLIGRHSIQGYYAYPAAFASIALGGLAAACVARLAQAWGRQRLAVVIVAVSLVAMLTPGSGIRTLIAHIRHWDDPNYDRRSFVRRVLADVPTAALTAVDMPYVIDFHLKHPRVVEALIDPHYYDLRAVPFDFLVLGRPGIRTILPGLDHIETIQTYGDPFDEFAHYAVLYRREDSP